MSSNLTSSARLPRRVIQLDQSEMFIVRKEIKKGDYTYALVPDHPHATKNGYVLLHRVIMENKLGRLLQPDEVVHHIDHNKKNNSIDNLQVLTNKEHAKLHHEGHKRTKIKLTCPECGRIFEREVYLCYSPRKFGPFCSRSCSGKFSRRLQIANAS